MLRSAAGVAERMEKDVSSPTSPSTVMRIESRRFGLAHNQDLASPLSIIQNSQEGRDPSIQDPIEIVPIQRCVRSQPTDKTCDGQAKDYYGYNSPKTPHPPASQVHNYHSRKSTTFK